MEKDNLELPFGILQKFIEPGEDHNSEIQAVWSKSITLFTKRTSKKSLNNRKMNIYERCCTFEGPEYFSIPSQVKDFQSQRISDQIQRMIQHLDAISFGKLNIAQGTFYFKVDKNAKCWFLFCGNLKFADDQRRTSNNNHNNTQQQIQIPSTIDNIMTIYSAKPVKLDKDQKCIRCNRLEKPCNFKTIPYQYLIEYCPPQPIQSEEWPKELREQAKQIKLFTKLNSQPELPVYLNTVTQMPITIEKIHSKINPSNFSLFKNDFEFNQRTIRVCMDCYITLSDLQQQLALKKARDNLDYKTFMMGQTTQEKVAQKPRIQYLNHRIQYNKKKSPILKSQQTVKRRQLHNSQSLSQYINQKYMQQLTSTATKSDYNTQPTDHRHLLTTPTAENSPYYSIRRITKKKSYQ